MTVEPLFQAMSDCSALHDSLLPNGQPSSFPFLDGDDDDEDGDGDEGAWEDADEEGGDQGVNGTGEANGGRVRSDFHSGGGPGARFRPY